jgi:hypothetical protein
MPNFLCGIDARTDMGLSNVGRDLRIRLMNTIDEAHWETRELHHYVTP